MQSAKSHRVVSRDYSALLSVRLTASAVECAENEGWPIPFEEPDLPTVLSFAGAMRHANEDVRIWARYVPVRRILSLDESRVAVGADVLHAAR